MAFVVAQPDGLVDCMGKFVCELSQDSLACVLAHSRGLQDGLHHVFSPSEAEGQQGLAQGCACLGCGQGEDHRPSRARLQALELLLLFVAQALLGTYGGYFGGGVGIMTTATYGLLAGETPRTMFAPRTWWSRASCSRS